MNSKSINMKNNFIEIYKCEDGTTNVEVKFIKESVWLNLNQIAQLFNKDKSVISRHLRNIYQEGELDKTATVAKFATVQNENKRLIKRNIFYYNLDTIISVGYRVNSKQGTLFRQWATKLLNTHLLEGFTLNERRLNEKQKEIKVLHDGIRILSRVIESETDFEKYSFLKQFSHGLKLLDVYDHDLLDRFGNNKNEIHFPEYSAYLALINNMRLKSNSSIFGVEKDGGFKSAIAQVRQEFESGEIYTSLEEKAAMLLYFIVKNHAFIDGNKRIAAACFLMLLEKNNVLINKDGRAIISNDSLASLTLFVAMSEPSEMATVKRLLISILNRNQTNY